jgi:short-subunit dehydrogenase
VQAFLTSFATSLAPEVKVDGIDVLVVHPSPVTSNFYNSTHKLDALEMFRRTGTSPDTIANAMLRSVGRTSVCDQGYYSVAVRVLLKVYHVAITTLHVFCCTKSVVLKAFRDCHSVS